MLRASLPSLPPNTHSSKITVFVWQHCGHFGHIARVCPNDAIEYGGGAGGGTGGGGGGFATRAPPPGRGLNVASLPPVKCYRCGGPNHMARYAICLAPRGALLYN
jgi:cellular nucleic acid-binding protein